jgi:hypothetical protein
MAAAVGSLSRYKTFRPAIYPATLVAYLCALLKKAGTVITASLTLHSKKASAISFIF